MPWDIANLWGVSRSTAPGCVTCHRVNSILTRVFANFFRASRRDSGGVLSDMYMPDTRRWAQSLVRIYIFTPIPCKTFPLNRRRIFILDVVL